MTTRKRLVKEAKTLLKASLKNGFIDEIKVKKILKLTSSQKRPEILKVLKIYKRLVEQEIAKEQLVIETATVLSQLAVKNLLKKTNARKIIHKTNPKMIFGARVTWGDWIYDLTLDNKLDQITQSSI